MNGLDEIMKELYAEGKEVSGKTAEEILARLEEGSNYIPPSARREYKNMVLKEYGDYVASQKDQAKPK